MCAYKPQKSRTIRHTGGKKITKKKRITENTKPKIDERNKS